jgi:hypothetical protein
VNERYGLIGEAVEETEKQEFIDLIEQNQGLIHKECRLYCNSSEDRTICSRRFCFNFGVLSPPSAGKPAFRPGFIVWLSTQLRSFNSAAYPYIFTAILSAIATGYAYARWHRKHFYQEQMEHMQQAIHEIEREN